MICCSFVAPAVALLRLPVEVVALLELGHRRLRHREKKDFNSQLVLSPRIAAALLLISKF